MQTDRAYAETGSASECVDWLLDMAKKGELWAQLKSVEGALHVAACLSKVIAAVFEKLAGGHDHENVFGTDPLCLKVVALASAMGVEIPKEGPLSDAMLMMILNALLEKLGEIFREWLDK